MAKEKPSNNNEELLKKLKTDLEEKERRLISVKSLELNGNNTLKKGQVIKEYGKEVGYIVKNIQTNQEGRKIVKLELTDGKTEEYELENQKVRDRGKNIETIWRKIGTTEGLRIGLPNNEHTDKTKEIVKEEKKELEEDMPQIIVMENKTSQPKKEKEDITAKMPKLNLIDGDVFTPEIGTEFYNETDKKRNKYTITKARTVKGTEKQLFKAKINPEDSSEEAIEMSTEEISKLMDKGRIFLDKKEEVKKKVIKKNIEPIITTTKKDEETLNEMAQSADKNREELMNEDKDPKTINELEEHHKIGKKIDEVLLKSFNDIEQKKLKEKLTKAKTNIQEKLKGKSRIDTVDIENKRKEELENPNITIEDVLKANPDYVEYGRLQIKKDSEKYLRENKEKAILAFKYLNSSLNTEEFLEKNSLDVNNTTIGKYRESFAKKEAEKWRFKFNEINNKYDEEILKISSKSMKTSSRENVRDLREKHEEELNIAQKEAEDALKEKKDLIVEKLDEKPKSEKLSKNTKNFFKETFLKQEKIKDSEEAKDQARREYIEAKNQKQSFWKFGFGSKKREQEIKEKEEAYMKAKKEYVEASGKDKMDFLLEEKQKFQTENIEKKGLSERIRKGIKGGMNLWENWDKNEKDSKFTQHIKRAGKTFVKIAIIGGASVGAATALASVGATWGAIALKGGVASYLGKKAVMGTAFASAINSVPPKHKGWVSKTLLVGSLGWAAYSTAGIGAIAGVAGYMGSKLVGNVNEKSIKAEVAAKIEALKEKQNQKVEKESFEDFEKRQNAIEKELAIIEKTANKDRLYRNMKKGVLALAIGTLTIEMSGAMQDDRDHHQPREYVPRDHDSIPKTEHHTTPIQETHTINPDAIIHKGEGIENAFIRQIEHSTEMAKSLGWDGKENLHHFAQNEAHALAIKEGYVDTNGNEIRVNVADKVGYEIKMENGHATVFEKSLDGKLTDTAHHEGDSFEKDTEKYEYKTTGNTHLEKPIPVNEESVIHIEKPTPVFENTQTNHPQELQADAPRLQFEEREEPALNLQYEHPQGDAGVIDPSSSIRNVNAFYTANHNEGPTNYQNGYSNGHQNNNIVYRNINPEQYYQNHIEHQHQILEQATKLHDNNIHQIFPRSNDYGEYADKPVRDYIKMEPEDTENPAEKELIKHIHNVHASTDLRPRPGNLFRNPETIEHYLDRAYEEAIKQGKIKEVVIE